MIRGKIKTITRDADRNDDDGGDVDRGSSDDWVTASKLAGTRGTDVDFSWRYWPPPFYLGQMFEKGMY